MKNRKKFTKVKRDKNTKKLIRMIVNRIIETTSTDDMNITDITLIQFAGTLLITSKIIPAKPTTNGKPGNEEANCMASMVTETPRPRGDLSIINEYIIINTSTSKKTVWKFKTIQEKHRRTL